MPAEPHPDDALLEVHDEVADEVGLTGIVGDAHVAAPVDFLRGA